MNVMEIRQENFRMMIEGYNKCYLFGAGYYANVVLDYYGDITHKYINGIIVTKKGGMPTSLRGISIYECSELTIEPNDVVIIAIQKEETVLDVLLASGCRNIIHLWQVVPLDDEKRMAIENRKKDDIANYINYFYKTKPLFKYIEIETVNRCNGVCSFCPVNANEPQREYHKMSGELFHNIIDQLSELEYNGLVALFSNNEPFLDSRISEFAKYARERLPNAYIYILTNGTLLTEKNFSEIMPYLNRLQIDNYTDEGMPENIREILSVDENCEYSEKVKYNCIPHDAVRNSRGSSSPNSRVYYTTEISCPLPFVQMVIRPDGKVSLCCNDALGQHTLGDANKDGLNEIWMNELFCSMREHLSGGRAGITTCRFCNHIDNRELWKYGIYELEEDWKNRVFPRGIPVEKECIIFGTDEKAIRFCEYLLKHGYCVYAFASNGYKGRKEAIITHGIKCMPVDALLEKTNACVYILLSDGVQEIYSEMRQYGFSDVRIVL